jgi:hypothetical protein
MRKDHIKFFVASDEDGDVLYAGSVATNSLFYFDYDGWVESVFSLGDILGDKDFVEVENYADEWISTEDALKDDNSPTSLIYCYPEQFNDAFVDLATSEPECEEE